MDHARDQQGGQDHLISFHQLEQRQVGMATVEGTIITNSNANPTQTQPSSPLPQLDNNTTSRHSTKEKHFRRLFRTSKSGGKVPLSTTDATLIPRPLFSLSRTSSTSSVSSTASTLVERRHSPFSRPFLRRKNSPLSSTTGITTVTSLIQSSPSTDPPAAITTPISRRTSTSSLRTTSSSSTSILKSPKTWRKRPIFGPRRQSSATPSLSLDLSPGTEPSSSSARAIQEPSNIRRRYSRWQNRLRAVSQLRNGALEHWERLIVDAIVGPGSSSSSSSTASTKFTHRRGRSGSNDLAYAENRSNGSWINSGGVKPMFWFWFYWCCFFSAVVAFGFMLGVLGFIGGRWSGIAAMVH